MIIVQDIQGALQIGIEGGVIMLKTLLFTT